MGKQVLEKCLKLKPQSEQNNVDFTTAYSHSIFDMIAVSLRRYVGKLNRPKMSVNLTNGTNKNVDSWFWGQSKPR